MEEFEGVVIKIQDDSTADVKISRHLDCGCCGACPGDNAPVIRVLNTTGAEVGRHVTVRPRGNLLLKSVFIVWVLPLLSVAGGILGGMLLSRLLGIWPSVMEICGGAAPLALSLSYIHYFELRMRSSGSMPVIVRVSEREIKHV
jgi:sigma-E factor negative regulatory protein RseC